MKPTLFVLAAGMGSRYGGLKQMDGLGPNGETIMDYSIYDAVRAGFGKVVFVIRNSFAKEFQEVFKNRFNGKIEVEFVYQEIENVPEGCTYNLERVKPWGTNHAVLMGKDVIKEPFMVINADDYYGTESFQIMHDFLQSVNGKQNQYAMVGYRLGNTLSDSGSVSRGVCETDAHGNLLVVTERTNIEKKGLNAAFKDENGMEVVLDASVPVSMNMWGFTPDYFDYSQEIFKEFLKENGQNPKSEFFIPLVITQLIQSGKASVKVLDTPSKWFGVTYIEDRPSVVIRINELVREGVCPNKLWE